MSPTTATGSPHRVPIDGLGPGEKRAIRCGETEVLLCNVDGEFFAVEDRCTHAAVSLAHGELRGCELECPVHGARFDVRNGAVLERPARRPLRRFAVSRDGDWLAIDLAPLA